MMIEFANGLDRLLQLLIIAQPASHLPDPFTPHAELSRAAARIGHSQHEYPMAFATRRPGKIIPESWPTSFGTMDVAAPQPRTAVWARLSLRDRMHRHDHDGRLFTTLRFDDRGPVHPPYHTICKANLVGSFV